MYVHILTSMEKTDIAEIDELFLSYVTRRGELLRLLLKRHYGDLKITPEQFAVLRILNRIGPSVSITEIADRVHQPHANLSRTLDRMENRGLVMRTRGRQDRRQIIIRLTLQGRRASAAVEKISDELLTRLWNNISPEDQTYLYRILSGND